MRVARFCSECGEQLNAKRPSLPFRAFCRRCSPRFNRARLILLAAFALFTAIGFAAGHYTSKREPFYLIGRPVELSANPNPDAARNSSHETEPTKPSTQPAIEAICGAPTKSGRPCQRRVKGGGYCWQHRDKHSEHKPPTNPP